MLSCKTVISLNGQQPVDCLPITHENALLLGENGVTTQDSAAVRLELDDHDELVVLRVGQTPVILERSGRKLQLREGKPVRICENDTLLINTSGICIVKSTFVIRKTDVRMPWLQTTKRILAASAAVFSMSVMCACEEDGNDAQQIQQGQQGQHSQKDKCERGAQKCDGNKVMHCENGVWKKADVCTSGDICYEASNTSAYCKPEALAGDIAMDCVDGEMRCDGNSVYKCDGGFWSLDRVCDAGDECVQVSNTSAFCDMGPTSGILPPQKECEDNEVKCEDNSIYKCDHGFWSLDRACDAGELCVEQSNSSAICELQPLAGDVSLDCVDGEMQCDGNNVYECEGGLWVLSNVCEGGSECIQISNTSAFCDMGPTAGVLPIEECQPGEMKCDNNSIYKCEFGYWALANKCEGDAICVERSNTSAVCEVDVTEGEMIPPECDDGAMKCEDNSIYKCVGGAWSFSKSCSDEEVCVSLSNTSAVCEVDVREGEMLPEIPTPSPVHPSEKSE